MAPRVGQFLEADLARGAPADGEVAPGHVFELPEGWSRAQPVHIGLEPGRRFSPRLAIESFATFEAGDVAYVRVVTALLAIIAVMCLVTGAFGLVLRERDFAVLSVTLACELAFLMLLMGEAYDTALRDYCALLGLDLDSLVVREVEDGVIPMTDGVFDPRPSPRVVRLGTAGGATRPSTGFTFTAMVRQAGRIGRELAAGRAPLPGPAYPARHRWNQRS